MQYTRISQLKKKPFSIISCFLNQVISWLVCCFLLLSACTSESGQEKSQQAAQNTEDKHAALTESEKDKGWDFLFEYEGRSILDLYDEFPQFKHIIEERLKEKRDLITEIEAGAAEIRREGAYIRMSATIRNGLPPEQDFYSSELIIDVKNEKLYALNYRSDSDTFSYYFDQLEVLPSTVIESLQEFYLRPSSKAAEEWNILDYYNLLPYSLTHPIKLQDEEYKIGHHFSSNIRNYINIVWLEGNQIEMSFGEEKGEIFQGIQILLFPRRNKLPLLGVNEYNKQPAWKGERYRVKFYELTKTKRLHELTEHVFSSQRLMSMISPRFPSKKYEGQHRYGLFHMMADLSPFQEFSSVSFNFDKLSSLCQGTAPEWLALHYDEDYTFHDEGLACAFDFEKWNNKEIFLGWDIEKGVFFLKDNVGKNPFLEGIGQAYNAVFLESLAGLKKQELLREPLTYLIEDEFLEQYRIGVQVKDGWLCWLAFNDIPLNEIEIDSVHSFNFDQIAQEELILYFLRNETLESGAKRESRFLQIWRLDSLFPYFAGPIACREIMQANNPQSLSYESKASLKIDIEASSLNIGKYQFGLSGTQNEQGEYLATDDMSGETYVLEPCLGSYLEELQGEYKLIKARLEKLK